MPDTPIDPAVVDGLPDGRYYDGTYEWDKEGTDWTPLRAPSGMPTAPRLEGLTRVRTAREPIDTPLDPAVVEKAARAAFQLDTRREYDWDDDVVCDEWLRTLHISRATAALATSGLAEEAERLQRIIDGYDRTPAEQRAADAETEVERLRETARVDQHYLNSAADERDVAHAEVTRLREGIEVLADEYDTFAGDVFGRVATDLRAILATPATESVREPAIESNSTTTEPHRWAGRCCVECEADVSWCDNPPATEPQADNREDERITAWHEVAEHPFFKPCLGTGGALLDAMIARLDAVDAPVVPESPDVREAIERLRKDVTPGPFQPLGGWVHAIPTGRLADLRAAFSVPRPPPERYDWLTNTESREEMGS